MTDCRVGLHCGKSEMRRGAGLSALLLVVGLCPLRLEAQQFGQWSWSASAFYQGKQYGTKVGSTSLTDYTEKGFRLAFGLRGFFVHPAIARFTASVDSSQTQFSGTGLRKSDLLGFHATLQVLPEGFFPLSLYASRGRYDIQFEDPEFWLLSGVPDQVTTYGGRFRIRKGFLAGTRIGFDRSEITYVTDMPNGLLEREFAEWSKSGERFKQDYGVERERRSFGGTNYDSDDLSVRATDRGKIGVEWEIESSSLYRHRQAEYRSTATDYNLLSLSNFATRTLGDSGNLVVGYDYGMSEGSERGMSHNLYGRYFRKLGRGFRYDLNAGYALQSYSDTRASVPNIAAGGGWSGRVSIVDLTVDLGVSYGRFDVTGNGALEQSSFFGGKLGCFASAGSLETLQASFEIDYFLNRLQRSGIGIEELPEFGIVGGVGAENELRTKVGLERKWHHFGLRGSSEYVRRQSSRGLSLTDYRLNSLTHELGVTTSFGNLNISISDYSSNTDLRQQAKSSGGTVMIPVGRWLSLEARYQRYRLDLAAGMPVDTEDAEAGISSRLGGYTLRLFGFRYASSLEGSDDQVSSGIGWSISRGFSGWLPIVTGGPARKGVIR